MIIWKNSFSLFLPLLFNLLATAQPGAPATIISLGVKAGLQFDIVRFRVNPGANVKIILTNTDDMSHNFVLTKRGTRLKVVNAALQLGEKGPAMNYVPKIPEVLFAIRVVGPSEVGEVAFTAPSTPGIYPYVCTLPGHGFVMYGAMYVTKNPLLPDIKNDEHIPPSRREDVITASRDGENNHSVNQPVKAKPLHPYTPKPPYLYRVFIDGASPAAIAVSLPNGISYCWDAGTCHLRFAWKGGFLDNSDLWKGKGDAEAKVMGHIFFRDTLTSPLQIGNADSTFVAYKGYRLINRYPEFHYTVNGVDVYELILPKADGTGIIREFKLPRVREGVAFNTSPQGRIIYKASAGSFQSNRLLLSASQAKHFSITITNGKAAPL